MLCFLCVKKSGAIKFRKNSIGKHSDTGIKYHKKNKNIIDHR